MTPERILVTGASGRIGQHVVRSLEIIEGVEVIRVGSPRSTLPITLDIGDSAAIAHLLAVQKPSVVIHLAGALPPSSEDFAVNESSTRAITAAVGTAQISRIVLASSAAIYGDSRVGALSESMDPIPTGMYGQSKVEAERTLKRATCQTAALRIFNVYGEGFVDSLVERLLRSAAATPVQIGDLDHFVRDYVHVDDVARAIVAAATVPLDEQHFALNVGTGIPVSNRELLSILSRRNTVHFEGGVGGSSHSVADTALATQVLGFSARRRLGS